MHLGFLTPEYPHPRTGFSAGIGTSIKNIVTELANRKIKVSLFVYSQKENAVFTEEGVTYHLIRHRRYKFLGWYFHRKFLQNYLNKLIAKEKIHAIEAPDWTGITAFINLKCPLVIRFHGSDAYFCKLENRLQKKKNFWFEKLALKNADHFLSVSQFTANETRRIFNLKENIEVIPNSVDVERFNPNPGELVPGDILYFGSLLRKKGVLELPEIFNLLVQENPLVRLLIAGRDVTDLQTGRSTRDLILEKFSPAASLKVEWLGNISYEAILEQLAKAHAVVLPSFAEALPMTWIETMAMEKALVTSDIGWAKEVMVNGETGFTVNPKDHETYAKKILQLLLDPALAKRMGKAARERVIMKFSSKVVAEQNIRFYEKVVASSEHI